MMSQGNWAVVRKGSKRPPPRGGGAAVAIRNYLLDESLKHKLMLALMLVSGELCLSQDFLKS